MNVNNPLSNDTAPKLENVQSASVENTLSQTSETVKICKGNSANVLRNLSEGDKIARTKEKIQDLKTSRNLKIAGSVVCIALSIGYIAAAAALFMTGILMPVAILLCVLSFVWILKDIDLILGAAKANNKLQDRVKELDIREKELLKTTLENLVDAKQTPVKTGQHKVEESIYTEAPAVSIPPEMANNPDLLCQEAHRMRFGLDDAPKNPQSAITYYTAAAKLGRADATNILGVMYRNGEGCSQNLKKSFEYFKQAAAKDHSDALNNLGYMYQHGEAVVQDDTKAIELFTKAAEAGNTSAHNNLGNMYSKTNIPLAIAHYTVAAEAGNGTAQYHLGCLYADKKDNKLAEKWLEEAAKTGDGHVQYLLGDRYMNLLHDKLYYDANKSIDIVQTYFDARNYLTIAKRLDCPGASQKLEELNKLWECAFRIEDKRDEEVKQLTAKSLRGDAQAANALGEYYLKGSGPEKARAFFVAAGEKNHPGALRNLGLLYLEGNGVEKNADTAIQYLQRAVDEGDSSAPFILGYLYDDRDMKQEALKLFTEAESKNMPSSHYHLGNLYARWANKESDTILASDHKKSADEWFTKAQNSLKEGSLLYSIGSKYLEGNGVDENTSKALKFLIQALNEPDSAVQAEAALIKMGLNESNPRHVYAWYHLGMHYAMGTSVPPNYDKAKEYFIKASVQGHIAPLERLGDICSIQNNKEEAIQIFEKAVILGSTKAKYLLGKLYANWATEDIDSKVKQRNKNLASHWFEKALQDPKSLAAHLQEMGTRYQYGDGVDYDSDKASQCNKAADKKLQENTK